MLKWPIPLTPGVFSRHFHLLLNAVYLMYKLISLGVLLVVLLLQAPVLAQLPQDHTYQITLRSYLATLGESDFDIELKPLTYEDSFLNSTDELHKTWLLMENYGRSTIMHNTGLRVASSHFVLSNIERDGEVYMRVGRNSEFFDPVNAAWWTTWDYPGNPYFNSRAGKLRMFVAVAVDMMMADQAMEQAGTGLRSDYLGGYLAKFGYVYYVTKDLLPLEVQLAYEEGLRKMFDRLQEMYPAGRGGGNMEMVQLAAMWYTAEALDDDVFRTRALNRARYVVGQVMPRAYFHHHGVDGIDLSYEGINQHFLVWGALLYDDPEINDYLKRSARLKAYLSLPEPEGHFYSPSHFNTGTSHGSAHDQWFSYQRDHAVAMLSDDAKYLIWSGSRVPVWSFEGLPDETRMREEIPSIIARRNGDIQNWTWALPSSNESKPWEGEHWVGGLLAIANHYQPGFYDEMRNLEISSSPWTKPPFLRGEDFIETFGDDFVVAKIGNYGAVIHTGTTASHWADGVPGLSGGSLSAFWTPTTGSIVLGRSRATQNAEPDTWEGQHGWDTWAVNAVSGRAESGKPFSSARHRFPEVSREIFGTDSASVRVTGAIGQHDNGVSAPDQAITGEVSYTRTFKLNTSGLTVISEVTSDGSDQIQELWETIPLFLRDKNQEITDAVIEFMVQGEWVEASEWPMEAVSAVRSVRFGEEVVIEFEMPRRVKLSRAVWESLKSGSRMRNIMIDLLQSNGESVAFPISSSVVYTLQAESSYLLGDPTGDRNVSALDAVRVLQHVTGSISLTSKAYTAADVSGDGTLNAYDASLILQYVVGLIQCLPADNVCG